MKRISFWHERSGLRLTAASTLVFALAGCSIFNPHVDPGIVPPYFPSVEISKNDEGELVALPEYAGGVVEAFGYAHAWQKEYYDAVGNDSLLRNLTVVPVVGAAAAALVLGITSSKPDTIAALSVGGAAGLGTSLFLQNAPRQRVYLEGYRTLNCAIAATGPYVMTTGEYSDFLNDLGSLRDKRKALALEINTAEAALGAGNEAVMAAKEALARAAIVTGNGQLLGSRVANAGRKLTAKVNDIVAQVSHQITETEPDPQAIVSLVTGLSGVTSMFGVAPPAPVESGAREDVPQPQGGAVAPDVSNLRVSTRDLVLATDLVNERVVAIDKAVEESGVLKACVPSDVAGGLTIRPRVDLLPVKPGQTYIFLAAGGTGPVTATFSGQMIGEIVQEGASFTLTVADDASGNSTIQFSDSETTRTITLVIDRGIDHLRPPPPSANDSALAPPECAPTTIEVDPSTRLTQGETDAGVTEAQVSAIQTGLGLEADGLAGIKTRGAICTLEKSENLPITGEIGQQLLLRFPEEQESEEGGDEADTCDGFDDVDTAAGALSDFEKTVSPRRLCEIQTAMGIKKTAEFDPLTRERISDIRENLGHGPGLTELTQEVMDALVP